MMEVTPSEGEAIELKAASERSRSPVEVQEGQESATVAEVHLPVEVEQMETPCPQWAPPLYCEARERVQSQRNCSSPKLGARKRRRTIDDVRATM